MNTLDHFLLKTASHDKVAFDQTLRNAGVDVLKGFGRTLRHFDDNPLAASAVLGAGVGGVHGAMTAEPGESRVGKALRNAVAGGVVGGATGGVLRGAAKNIGRYGRDIEDLASAKRGVGGFRDVQAGEFGEIMRDRVLNRDSIRGGRSLIAKRTALADAERAAAGVGTEDAARSVREARKALNEVGGGLGTRFTAPEAAAMIAGAGAAGGVANSMREKNSSLRIREVLDKQANFSALAAKAVGLGAQGAGRAIQVGAANPALAGAAIGAAGGAIMGGEGNRLKGALIGGGIGAAGGAAAGKFAPDALGKIGQAGQNLSRAGKDTSVLAGGAKQGDTFKDLMSDQFKGVTAPFKPATP